MLIGWALSQISLGFLFWGIDKKEVFYVLVFVVTLGFAIAAFLGLREEEGRKVENLESLI